MCPPASGPLAAKPAALDGGWGWVVVLCSFMALLLGYGSPQSLGILYPEWLLSFGEGKAMTAWVGSLVAGGGLIVGEEPSARLFFSCVSASSRLSRLLPSRSRLQCLRGELRGSACCRLQRRDGGGGVHAQRLRSQRLLPHLLLRHCGW